MDDASVFNHNNHLTMKPNGIDNYCLTSMEELTEAMLAQIMHEAAEETRLADERATTRYFNELKEAAAHVK